MRRRGEARRSRSGSDGPGAARMSDESGSAIVPSLLPASVASEACGVARGAAAWVSPAAAPAASGGLGLVFLFGLLVDEGLVLGDLGRQDATDVLDLVFVLVHLELILELHLLADEGALRVRPHVAHLGGRRERDLPVVRRVLVDLADDDPYVV